MSEALTTLPPETRASVALNSSQTEMDLRALAVKNVNITQVIDKPGRDQAHGAAMEIKRSRVSIERIAKEARDDATKFSKAVIAEEKRLIAIIEPEEARMLGLRDGWDAEQERIRREKEDAERRRVQALHARIDEIKGYVAMALDCRTSARVEELIEKVTALSLDGFEEFSEDAAFIHAGVLTRMKEISDAKFEEEKERTRAQQEREAQAAALVKEREELAAERAKLAQERAELEATKAPADEFQKDLQAFEAATAQPAPAPAAPIVLTGKKVSAPLKTSASRPTDAEIIEVLSLHYRVHESKVIEWLLALDLETASAALAAEFA